MASDTPFTRCGDCHETLTHPSLVKSTDVNGRGVVDLCTSCAHFYVCQACFNTLFQKNPGKCDPPESFMCTHEGQEDFRTRFEMRSRQTNMLVKGMEVLLRDMQAMVDEYNRLVNSV